jgi:hypothetical protein
MRERAGRSWVDGDLRGQLGIGDERRHRPLRQLEAFGDGGIAAVTSSAER